MDRVVTVVEILVHEDAVGAAASFKQTLSWSMLSLEAARWHRRGYQPVTALLRVRRPRAKTVKAGRPR